MRGRFLSVLFVCLGVASQLTAQTATAGLNAQQLFDKGMNALMGSGVTRSDLNAIEYFHRSAELGFAPAQVVLGYLLETGRGSAVSPREAFDWYKKRRSRMIRWRNG